MAILPYNFENQAITAAGLAAALRALLADGPLHGCAIGFDGATVSIAPGRIIIGGYVFRLSAAAVVDVPTTESTASVVVRLDLSKPSTAGSFEQIELRAEAGDYTPVRSDLDAGTGNVYRRFVYGAQRSPGLPYRHRRAGRRSRRVRGYLSQVCRMR